MPPKRSKFFAGNTVLDRGPKKRPGPDFSRRFSIFRGPAG
jgi:hypothetical protein